MPKQKKLCLDWQPYKEELQNLYLIQDLSLERLMRHMEETHGFRATKAQYETQLKKWNIRKNLTNEEWNYTLLQVRKRKFDGKESDVYLNGKLVPERRIKKEMSRHFTLTQEQLLDTVSIPSTPEAITVSTPHAEILAAAGSTILHNLPYFQFQAFLESAALFSMNPAQSPRIGTIQQNPSFTSRVSDEWDALALFQEIASPLHATFAEEGKMLLAGLFGPKMQADGDGFLSQIGSQMLVSSLERYDGELLEKSQLLCGPSRQSSVLRILEFALYRMSNNLLSEEAADEFTRWLIKQQQNGLLTSFLKTKIPTVHACATKFLESVLRNGDADFLELLIDSGIDISPMKGVCGGRNLVHAAMQGNLQIVQMLLKNGADVNILPTEQYPVTALQTATFRGRADMVEVLLKAGAYVDAVSPVEYRNTALSEAVFRGNIELVRILLTAGANIDNCIIWGRPAIEDSARFLDNDELHHILLSASSKEYSSISYFRVIEAASTGTEALSRYLAENFKAEALIHEAVLEHALITACEDSRHDAVMSLLDIGLDPNCFGVPLRNAVSRGDFELIKILLQASADVNTWGVLTEAISHDMRRPNGIRMVQFLLNEGANFDTHGEAETKLQYAAVKGDFEAVEFLVSSGVDVNTGARASVSNKRTVLQNAVSSGVIEMVKLLLDAGADVNAISYTEGDQTALEIAVRNDDLEMVQVLLSAGADVNAISYTEGDQTALEIAVRNDDLGMVQVLLSAGADVNIPDEERIGASILQIAIAEGDEELFSMLLKEGADVNSLPEGHEGRSPIQEAATTGNLLLIKLLLEAGADINAPAGHYYGRTALQAAATSLELPTMELIDFLLDEAGADIHAPAGEEGGVTALQGAAIRGHMKIALKFLEAGADVNAEPALIHGRTALEGAAEYGRLDMVQMLLNAGAGAAPCGGDETKSNSESKSSHGSHPFAKAIELARNNGHFAIVSLLEQRTT